MNEPHRNNGEAATSFAFASVAFYLNLKKLKVKLVKVGSITFRSTHVCV